MESVNHDLLCPKEVQRKHESGDRVKNEYLTLLIVLQKLTKLSRLSLLLASEDCLDLVENPDTMLQLSPPDAKDLSTSLNNKSLSILK